MALSTQDIARMELHDDATAERVRMVARLARKRTERNRTLTIRAARNAKYAAQGRV